MSTIHRVFYLNPKTAAAKAIHVREFLNPYTADTNSWKFVRELSDEKCPLIEFVKKLEHNDSTIDGMSDWQTGFQHTGKMVEEAMKKNFRMTFDPIEEEDQ